MYSACPGAFVHSSSVRPARGASIVAASSPFVAPVAPWTSLAGNWGTPHLRTPDDVVLRNAFDDEEESRFFPTGTTMQIAQTNLQLYNQLRARGRSADELALIRQCYELSVILYANAFQADGKPFVAHTVGVASIVAHAGLPAAVIGAGCLHNVYGNADFGDGLDDTVTPERRSFVRDAVGDEVEQCIYRFRSLRLTTESIPGIMANLDNLDARGRDLITMDIADHLEKYADFGLLYYSDNAWVTDAIDSYGNSLIDIARRLGHDILAEALSDAVESARSQTIPAELKRSDHREWLEFVTPRSCAKRNFQ